MECGAMLDRYKYTDSEVEKICKSIVILCDSREQVNTHVTDWFNRNKVPWETKALGNGDYSFYLPKNEDFGILRDTYFTREIAIERKRNLDEIAVNFTKSRARFEEEFATYPGKLYLLIENATYVDIINHNYSSKLTTKAFLAAIHTFNHRYHTEVSFMPDDKYSGAWIYGTFLYYLKNLLKR